MNETEAAGIAGGSDEIKRVTIIGTGLIGGSIGMRLRATGRVRVLGYDASAANAEAAVEAGAVDEAYDEVAAAVGDAHLVVVATPVGEILPTIEALSPHAKTGVVVTDVGSTKETIVEEAERILGPQRAFVGGHPMAGTEGEGIASARDDLFDNALWILTPTKTTESAAYRAVNTLVARLGARVLALEPAEHDRLVALVSHLPYAIATSLMTLAAREGDPRLFEAAAGSFRDVTRTAGSNPRVWRDIFATNAESVVRELDEFAAVIESLRSIVSEGRWDDFDSIVATARDARRRLPVKGERTPVEPVTLEIAIRDRAGVLAEVTTAMGEGGINIEDLLVDHTPAGGVLRLILDGHQTARRATELLAGRGFRATIIEDG